MAADAWQAKPARERLAQLQNTQVVAIFAWGSSGSTFLQSLLDFHPEVLMFPIALITYYHTDFNYFIYKLSKEKPNLNYNEFLLSLLDLFCAYYRSAFDNTNIQTDHQLHMLGEQRNTSIQVNPQRFIEHATTLFTLMSENGIQMTRAHFLVVVHYAYALAQNQVMNNKHLIIYPIHDPENYNATRLAFEDFPHMRAIVTLRHPMKSLHSNLRITLQHLQTKHPETSPEDLVATGKYLHFIRFQLLGYKNTAKQYDHAVLYQPIEQLHADPKGTMQHVAQWLGIQWHDCLLKSTFNGLTYWGSRYQKTPFSGFSLDYHNQFQEWKQQAGWVEWALIMGLLKDDVEAYGYGKISRFHRWLLPLLIVLPTRQERRALFKFYRNKDTNKRHHVIVNILERYWWIFRYLFGFEVYTDYKVVSSR